MHATDTAESEYTLYLRLKSKYEFETDVYGTRVNNSRYITNEEYLESLEEDKPIKKNRQNVAPPVRNKGGRRW